MTSGREKPPLLPTKKHIQEEYLCDNILTVIPMARAAVNRTRAVAAIRTQDRIRAAAVTRIQAATVCRTAAAAVLTAAYAV